VATTAPPTVKITANPTTIYLGDSAELTVTAANATSVTVTGTDNRSYDLAPTGGTQGSVPRPPPPIPPPPKAAAEA
jgi:hypothetical protein